MSNNEREHTLIARPVSLPGYSPRQWCAVCGKTTIDKPSLNCEATDCPNLCHPRCLGTRISFNCSEVTALRQAKGISHPVVHLTDTSQAPQPGSLPDGSEDNDDDEDSELSLLQQPELIRIVKSLRAELKKAKAALASYDPSTHYLAEKRDSVVSVLNFLDNIIATKSNVEGLETKASACTARAERVDADWQQLIHTNQASRTWWTSKKPRPLASVTPGPPPAPSEPRRARTAEAADRSTPTPSPRDPSPPPASTTTQELDASPSPASTTTQEQDVNPAPANNATQEPLTLPTPSHQTLNTTNITPPPQTHASTTTTAPSLTTATTTTPSTHTAPLTTPSTTSTNTAQHYSTRRNRAHNRRRPRPSRRAQGQETTPTLGPVPTSAPRQAPAAAAGVAPRTRGRNYCGFCRRRGHSEESCYRKLRCEFCGRLGHTLQECRSRLGQERQDSFLRTILEEQAHTRNLLLSSLNRIIGPENNLSPHPPHPHSLPTVALAPAGPPPPPPQAPQPYYHWNNAGQQRAR